MFFDKSDISAVLLDVLELKQKNINKLNTERNFNALSFRISADAELSYDDKVFKTGDNDIIFSPANRDYTRRAKHDHLIAVHFNIQNYYFSDIELLKIKNPEIISGLFCEILKVWQSGESDRLYKCTSIFYDILAECFKENYLPQGNESKISASVKFMEANFTDANMRMKEIADKSFMSEVYFRKLFKEEYGISPAKYLSRLKINRAVNLISTGYYSLKEVAMLAGYSDYAYFSEDFKKHKGCAPSEYFYNYKE